MPTYDYQCNNPDCAKNKVIKEVVQKMTDPHPECELCKKIMFRQVVIPGGFILKGDGWYKPND